MNDDLYDDILGRGKGDPDTTGKWVGDKPVVEYQVDWVADWVYHRANEHELGDQMADHSDQQGYDDWKENDD